VQGEGFGRRRHGKFTIAIVEPPPRPIFTFAIR
jgi:hypothetical protein